MHNKEEVKKRLVKDVFSINIQSVIDLKDAVYEIRNKGIQLTKTGDFIQLAGFKIRLTHTKNGYGMRYWFKCPKCSCNTGNLYVSEIIACRRCCNLSYQTQNRTPKQNREMKLKKRIYSLQDKLKITDENCDYILPVRASLWRSTLFNKPKHMHWKTFFDLQGELTDTQFELMNLINEQFPL